MACARRFLPPGAILSLALLCMVTAPRHAFPASSPFAQGFGDWSDGATLRLDYDHGGTMKDEVFALDGLRREGPWPGSRVNLVDPLNLGAYRFEVRDRATRALLFAAGFSSIYGEWETTEDRK